MKLAKQKDRTGSGGRRHGDWWE